jgi:undecaprenyl-diphosphatase
MKKETKRDFIIALFLLTAFVLWTLAVCHFDIAAVGPEGSQVGFSTVNRLFHSITGVNFSVYVITDWLGLVPVAVCLGFAILGLVQWIKRNDIRKVDRDILILGGFYIVVMAMYILFEYVVINRRPVLINGFLEASYPSSTTLLVLCVMPSAMMQLNHRIKSVPLRNTVTVVIAAFTVFMVIGRLISGVHWLSDIIGGVLLSAGLVMLYRAACNIR